MSEWTRKTIAECADDEPYSTQIGPFGKALTPEEYTETGVPLLRGVNVNRGRFYDDGFVFVSEETANRLSKFESYPGDVLLVHKGTLGQIGLMPKSRKYPRYLMGNSMLRVRCHPEKLIPEYLYYWLSSPEGQHYLFSRVSQVGVPQIQRPLTTLREASLPVPPLPEQKAIARILSSLDDKIELNRRMNETLEAMARAIFKDWFVDFGPTRAKMSGRAAYLPEHIWSLFPEAIDPETNLPQGWEVKKLFEITSKIGSGATPRGGSKIYIDEGVALIRSQNVYDSEFRWQGLARITEEIAEQLRNVIVEPQDILLNITGDSILRTCIVDPTVLPARVNQHVAIIRAKVDIPYYYLHLYLLQDRIKNILLGFDTGATRKAVTKGQLELLPVLVPDEFSLEAFRSITDLTFAKVQLNLIESRTLADLRDRLLPKLMSGEIRVKAAEKMIEEVL